MLFWPASPWCATSWWRSLLWMQFPDLVSLYLFGSITDSRLPRPPYGAPRNVWHICLAHCEGLQRHPEDVRWWRVMKSSTTSVGNQSCDQLIRTLLYSWWLSFQSFQTCDLLNAFGLKSHSWWFLFIIEQFYVKDKNLKLYFLSIVFLKHLQLASLPDVNMSGT